MNKYLLKYRNEKGVVVEGVIEASTLEKATELGKQYCSRAKEHPLQRPRVFISVSEKDPILIREGDQL